MTNLKWLGHASFLLQTENLNIYIDPWKLPQNLPKADLILITHDHYDHCSVEDVKKISKPDTTVICPKDSAAKFENTKIIKPQQTIELKNVKIKSIPAYNINKSFHPKSNNWLGYVMEVESTTYYHAGDTDFIPEMKDLKPDYALLPVGGTYTMNRDEAAAAAESIKPKTAIPMHYGDIVGSIEDAKYFAKQLSGKINVEILTPQK